jgi:hypothetical protein
VDLEYKPASKSTTVERRGEGEADVQSLVESGAIIRNRAPIDHMAYSASPARVLY